MPSSTEPRPRRTPHSDGTGRAGLDTGNELCQLNEITAVQRQIDDLAGIDYGSDGGIFGFQAAHRSWKSTRSVCNTWSVTRSTLASRGSRPGCGYDVAPVASVTAPTKVAPVCWQRAGPANTVNSSPDAAQYFPNSR
jgi:hypothetical protein